jgi:hypothetical protein
LLPGDLILRGLQAALHVRQRYVGNGRIQRLHAGGQRHRQGDESSVCHWSSDGAGHRPFFLRGSTGQQQAAARFLQSFDYLRPLGGSHVCQRPGREGIPKRHRGADCVVGVGRNLYIADAPVGRAGHAMDPASRPTPSGRKGSQRPSGLVQIWPTPTATTSPCATGNVVSTTYFQLRDFSPCDSRAANQTRRILRLAKHGLEVARPSCAPALVNFYMKNLNNQNFLRGLFLVAIALLFGLQSFHYKIGDLSRAGPGLFPLMISILVFLIGVASLVRSRYMEPIPLSSGIRNIGLVLLGICGFALFSQFINMIVGIVFLVFCSSFAGVTPYSVVRNLKISAGLIVIALGFQRLLGLNLPLY